METIDLDWEKNAKEGNLSTNDMKLICDWSDKKIEETNGLLPIANGREDLHALVLSRFRKMTPEQGFHSLIASGIYTSDGQLSKEYDCSFVEKSLGPLESGGTSAKLPQK